MENSPVIIGMACRVAGANSPSKLWDNILQKKDLRREMPPERFNVDAFYHPDRLNNGTTNVRHGYFLDQPLGHFDAEFFGISGKEAAAIDPQQRILLEVVYEALENAEIALEDIRGTNTSVYCGTFANANDYNSLQAKDLEHYPIYALTGTGNPILSNRISYLYDLRGPSMTIDTACSSSLVAFHLGAQSLVNGESNISIIAGTALQFAPNIYQTISDMGFLSDDGRCRCFDADGGGYVRGDGVCAVILKRQVDALSSGNRIRAVVRGTAANHDGKTEGITLPSAEAQAALFRTAYRCAGIDPVDTQYFEAHGTGTKAGDPREARAIGEVFGTEKRKNPIWVGSVKPNIGHLEGAAGLSGLIKATLALEKGIIPPNMLFRDPNPDIKFEEWKIRVPTTETAWTASNNLPRRASINSSGYGGSNAHVILEGYDHDPRAKQEEVDSLWPAEKRSYLLPITSHSPDAGVRAVDAIIEYLNTTPIKRLADLANTLSTKRTFHRWRAYCVGHDQRSVVQDFTAARSTSRWVDAGSPVQRVGFIFTGQGALSFDTGRDLIEQFPLFREVLERCDLVLQSLEDRPSWTIRKELMRSYDKSRLNQSQFSQPISTAIQVALVCLLKAWGVTPTAVCGHSSGEIACAYAAGIISLEVAIIIAYYRGLYMSRGAQTGPPGAMMAVGIGQSSAMQEVHSFQGRLNVAAINGPTSVTISGDRDAILELKESLDGRGIFTRLLKVEQAYHSHHMAPLAPDYQRAIEKLPNFKTQPASCHMVSSVTARACKGEHMAANYWAQNMVSPVRFSDALTGIVLNDEDQQNVDVLLEIGPHPALKSPAIETVSSLSLNIPYIGTLSRNRSAQMSLLEATGQLFSLGYPVRLEAINQTQAVIDGSVVHKPAVDRLHDLPSYSWNHKDYWFMTRLVSEHVHRPWRHALLGAPVPGSLKNMPRFRNYIRLSELPWLKDHVIDARVVFPAAAFVCMAIEGAARMETERANIKMIRVRDVSIKAALTLREDSEQGHEVLTELYPTRTSSRTTSDSWFEFVITSYDDTNEGIEHCRGRISVEYGFPQPIKPTKTYPPPEELLERSDRYMTPAALYSRLEDLNSMYGPRFALIKNDISTGDGFGVATMSFDPNFQTPHELSQKTIVHPTFLDASFHVMLPVIEALLHRQMSQAFVSTFMGSLDISGMLVKIAGTTDVQHYNVSTFTELPSPRLAINDILIAQPNGDIIIEARNIEATAVETRSAKATNRTLYFRQRWQPCFDFLSDISTISFGIKAEDLSLLLDLFSFQFPMARILYISSEPNQVPSIVEESLWFKGTQRPRFQELNLWTLAKEHQKLEVTSFNKGLITLTEPTGLYALVVIDANLEEFGYPNVSKFLDDTGVIIAKGSLAEDEVLDQIVPPNPWGIFRPVRAAKHAVSPPDVTVLMPASYRQSDRTTAVLQDLRSSNKINIASTMELQEVPKYGLVTSVAVVIATLDESFDSTDDTWFGVRELLQTEKMKVIWVVEGATMECENPDHAALLGLLRTARNENPDSLFVSLDVQHKSTADSIAERLIQIATYEKPEEEFSERNGQIYIPRVEEDVQLNRKLPHGVGTEPKHGRFGDYPALTLRIGQVGLLESLHFVENQDFLSRPLGDHEVEIKVAASSLNFHDIAVATGIIQDYQMGDECAGFVTQAGKCVDETEFKVGDRVVAFSPGMGAHGTIVRPPANFCHKVPSSVNLSEVVSLPVVLSTALYCLVDIARLQAGETVLIHAGAGGVGQVAIQIAQNIGARIFVTCSKLKRSFLRERYGLADSQIFSSRDDGFAAGILAATNGEGVDVVLNSLAGHLLQASWGCIKKFGRFVEIGKRDIHQNSGLGMEPFRRNATFAAVDMVLVFQERPNLGREVLARGLDMFFHGVIKPPSELHTFSFGQVEKAFRMLQLGRKPGKVILIPEDADMVLVKPTPYQQRPLFSPLKTYLLVGGLGGLGTALTEWMHLRGARRFAFLSRSGARTPEARNTIAWLQSKKALVNVFQGDIGSFMDVKCVIDKIRNSLGGIFHMAVELHDAMIRSTSLTQIRKSFHTKVQGARNLHEATISLSLDYFVCFSSVSDICGNKGQGAYGAANAWIDAFMRWRREHGYVATAMNAGTVTTRGLVANNSTAKQSLERSKWDIVTEKELMYLAEECVMLHQPQPCPPGLDWHQIIVGINVNDPDVFWADRSLFRNLYANRSYGKGLATANNTKNVAGLIKTAGDKDTLNRVVLGAFLGKIASVLGIAVSSLAAGNPLSYYGLDSIIAIEFRRWFTEVLEVDISMFDILAAKSIQALVSKATSVISTSFRDRDQRQTKHENTNIPLSPKSNVPTARGEIIRSGTKAKAQLPLSTYQIGLAKLLRESSTLSAVVNIRGMPSIDGLEGALRILIYRHSALRTAIPHVPDGDMQYCVAIDRFKFVFKDMSSPDDPIENIEQLISQERRLPLNIGNGEVGVALLMKIEQDFHKLIIRMHPLCFDGSSLTIFLEEWCKLYDAIINNQDTTIVKQPQITYGDFALWQKTQLDKKRSSDARSINSFCSRPCLNAISSSPTANQIADGGSNRRRVTLSLAPNMLSRMKRITASAGALPVHFIFAAFRSFLLLETGAQDPSIMIIDEERPHVDVEGMIGCFTRIIPIRISLMWSSTITFENLLQHTKERLTEAVQNADVNIEEFASHGSTPPGDRDGNTITQVAIHYEDHDQTKVFHSTDFEMSVQERMLLPLQVSILLKAIEAGEGLMLLMDCSLSSIPSSTDVNEFLQSFVGYLSSLIRDHRQPVLP
ncbi:putative Hybrid PKS-NRPS biosynthetic cluster [Aspergillus niger]|nr:putative Hybrid PKS-NRPS biosynthetic cluster [Aspergillus niger]